MVFVLLHNAFGGLAMLLGGENLLTQALHVLSVACFYLALLCPAAAGVFASAALITRLLAGGPVWLRRALLVVVPVGAAWFGLRVITRNPISLREKSYNFV